MPEKRKRVAADDASRSTILKRSRHTATPDLLSLLSDELLVRILSFLSLPDLLRLAPVSDRFYHLSGDSQIWKRLYYSRFVLPRALLLPGFRNGSARDRKLHYSSRRTIWADGRRGGWVDMRSGDDKESHDWKRQYKLHHNWAKGKCAVEELHLGEEPGFSESTGLPNVLVKVLDGIAVTADAVNGLRAWDLKTRKLLAQIDLDKSEACAMPSCMALDDQQQQKKQLDIALGFTDGSFGVWRLCAEQRRIVQRYRHEASSNGEIVGAAFLYPYLLTATATTSILISLYTFDRPLASNRATCCKKIEVHSETGEDCESETTRKPDTKIYSQGESLKEGSSKEVSDEKGLGLETILHAPYLLTSLKSHTSRAPLALSIRKVAGRTVASIAYTFSTIRGWSLGIQELHIRPSTFKSRSEPDITTTKLAYTLPVNRTSARMPSPPSSPVTQSRSNLTINEERDKPDGPISLAYTHPYLLATLPDNTLVLYLCTSDSSSLAISSGIRLWGHTSGISDAEITARGKAVSVSCRGEEIRVWELEGRTNGGSIEVRPTAKTIGDEATAAYPAQGQSKAAQWDDRRNWVGFDDEMVIVLKESSEGRESLLVYDFT
ncbi:hypothetical protein F5Y19DRAFT_477991 [Xylariaceae sp. FL1651]|nr:hypothetical protein F5Y19DRAFT_477991 [Xylariaceae sp. FL1651]